MGWVTKQKAHMLVIAMGHVQKVKVDQLSLSEKCKGGLLTSSVHD